LSNLVLDGFFKFFDLLPVAVLEGMDELVILTCAFACRLRGLKGDQIKIRIVLARFFVAHGIRLGLVVQTELVPLLFSFELRFR
jgi:hypothetical protein